jgi:DNA primase
VYAYSSQEDSEMDEWVDFGAVKALVSLEAVLRYYHVPGLQGRRDQLIGLCPIHQGKREDSFRASLRRNVFHCFACQASGNVLDFVAAMEKCSVRQAALHLQRWFSLAVPSEPAVAWQQPALGRAGQDRGNWFGKTKSATLLYVSL